ncbi:MAG: GNAT family protein [Gaiellaceae bacterium]
MELHGDRVVLRPLTEGDVSRLVEIGSEPEVFRWWGAQPAEDMGAKARGEEPDETFFAILVDGELAGLIQFHEENEPDFRHAGIDLFLSESFQGNGLGVDAVRTVARHLVRDRGHHRLVIDPAADNERAIRCYEKVGFRRVGVMREYWRDPDGAWRDGLLLDLLADELA